MFITLTKIETGNPELFLNVNKIAYVKKTTQGKAVIYYEGGQYIQVNENYDDVVSMINAAL